MGRARHLSPTTRARVVALRKQNVSYSRIGQEVGRSKKACINAWKLHEETGQYRDRRKTGRPRKTDERQDNVIKLLSMKDRKKTAEEISRELARHHGVQITTRTVRRRLNFFGLFGRVAKKKPYVSLTNRRHRVEFARAHLHWTANDWQRVLFSDEKKFNRIASDGKVYVRRKIGEAYAPQCLRGTVKGGGGSVMVWGSFSRDGVGPVHQIHGIMDQYIYRDLLRDVMLPYSEDHLPLNWIFQQDNDPKHTAHTVRDWLANNQITVLDWPSQSPDLNPIEHLWAIVQKDVQKNKPRSIKELYPAIEAAWARVSIDDCIKLVDSMPHRCAAVIKYFGYPTPY